MRKLTIKREKSFVACLVKMKVYIEDPVAYELTINGVGCRKLGELKNGEEKTFDISYGAARVFVIVDKTSKEYCSDVWQIPMGEEDITLSGKNKYNPASGNAFRFNGNATEETKSVRKKGTKIGVIILVASCFVGVLLGLLPIIFDTPEDKVFTNSGMTITLTDEFMKVDQEGFEICYGSPDVAVLISRDKFSDLLGLEEFTLQDYGELVIENFEIEGGEVTDVNGLTAFEYEAETEDGTYYYFVTIHKSDDSFWLVQFATLSSKIDGYVEDFLKWADSVRFEG